MVRKAGSEGFAAHGHRELGQAPKRLDNTRVAGKPVYPVTREIHLLERSILIGSETGAVLATQENSYDNTRIIDSSTRIVTSREATHIMVMGGPLNLLARTTSMTPTR